MRRALLFWVFILVTTPVLQAQQPAERSSSRVTIAGETFYVHTVKPGETFYSLSRRFGITDLRLIFENDMRFLSQF